MQVADAGKLTDAQRLQRPANKAGADAGQWNNTGSMAR